MQAAALNSIVCPARVRSSTTQLRGGVSALRPAKTCQRAFKSTRRCSAMFASEDSSSEKPKIPPTPMGLPVPSRKPNLVEDQLNLGFYESSEIINGRFAMFGIFALVIVEAILGEGLLEFIGVEVGNGINLGF
ncbi:hypothetical protein CYMTET_52616 [Cymbomonas tetramitiformis]|uniref:Uncharacterized protein n=1 Tax=Cymbomonas tetramitiformis TaxID=36881 RepID=A0AAE0BIN5_9CHLO|nr:hypothetical protein CYMTET_52616 [Cymbomonas tetramitiformis]